MALNIIQGQLGYASISLHSGRRSESHGLELVLWVPVHPPTLSLRPSRGPRRLATVPDGSTVRFAADGCYGQDGTITLTGRKGLVIDGRGAEFRAPTPGDSHRANWRFVGGSDLTVQNMAVRGSDPQGAYDPSVE